jgi:hypothetical protein
VFFQPHDGVKCTAGNLWPNVDTRGAGGYIIWWPACGFDVIDARELAPVPDWILHRLNPPRPSAPAPISTGRKSCKKIDGVLRIIARAAEGERNHAAYWGACRLAEMVADGSLSQEQAIELVIEAASRTGLSEIESRNTAKSALKRFVGA